MERQGRKGNRARGLWAALVILVPALLAGCAERPAYVINPERSAAYYPAEHPYFTVTVREGDSISKIAERCNTTTAQIAELNDMDEFHEIYPGEVLRVPSRPREDVIRRREEVAYVPRPVPRPHYTPVRYDDQQIAPRPRHDDVDAKTKNVADNHDNSGHDNSGHDNSWWSWWMTPREEAPADTETDKFIWPVRGPIIEGFGGSRHGERNDGINIATQEGAPIRAAAAGTVTYTGNELKGYGNLVLIRHDDGYVTAYAHAGSIRVTRGDMVEKGQVIGTTGATGDVDQPQLHFEIRRGTQAVDPQRYLVADRAS
jgi:murein DD-endopeptidase MepM/ murein hydrolase activator NlpD